MVISAHSDSVLNSHYFIFWFYPTGRKADGEDIGPVTRTPVETGHRAPTSMPHEGFLITVIGTLGVELVCVDIQMQLWRTSNLKGIDWVTQMGSGTAIKLDNKSGSFRIGTKITIGPISPQ